ncbi:MAG: hypothetical protein V8R08_00290 [Coriobacteriales bacterium]
MESVTMVTFPVESQAYETFSHLKGDPVNASYTILQMVIVKNEDGVIVPKDGFDSGTDTTDDTWMGGLLGAAVGILGGPVGILLGGGVGLLAGSLVDDSNAEDDTSLIAYCSRSLLPGQTAVIALVQEDDTADFDTQFEGMDCAIMHWDAAEIADEVEQAEEVQAQLAKEAHDKLRAQRKADRHEAIEKKRAEIKQKFEDFKKKL